MPPSSDELRVCMTVLGRKGGMDGIADLTSRIIGGRRDLNIRIMPLTTRGSGGIFPGAFIFLVAVIKFWLAGRRGQIDILHLNLAAGGSAFRKSILARVARWLKIPYVIHLHAGRFVDFWTRLRPHVRRRVDRLFLESERVIVLGNFWAKFVTGMLPPIRGKVAILPNATRSIFNHRERSNSTNVHIAFIGAVGPAKGTPQLIEALGSLGEHDWSATIAGAGDVEEARARAQVLGIADRVAFPGWLNEGEIDNLLRRTDILTLPSFTENLPMVILEGFAHGVAVVATPVGAIPEVIDHERNGLIVPVGDVNALALAIRRLIENPDLRNKLGYTARQDHAIHYDIDLYVSRLAAIWRQATARSREPQSTFGARKEVQIRL